MRRMMVEKTTSQNRWSTPLLLAVLALLAVALVTACGKSNNEPPAALNPAPPLRKAFTLSLIGSGTLIRNYGIENDGVPKGKGVAVLVAAGLKSIPRTDPWGEKVRYVGSGLHYKLSSAGPDRQWGTKDDIVVTDKQTPF